MARLGQILLIIGLVVTVLSLVSGFYFMFNGSSQLAQALLMVVPFGFLTLFMGFSTIILFSPREKDSNK